jgi:hypothetical protein
MSKAIVLPINILVIVAIATVATLGLASIYGVGYNPFSSAIGLESVKNLACRKLVFGGCKVNTSDIPVSYDANKNGVNDTGNNINWATGIGDDNLATLCYNFFGRKDEKSCKQLCGCVGTITSGPTGPKGNFTVSLSSYSGTLPPDSGTNHTGVLMTVNWIGASPPPMSVEATDGAPPATFVNFLGTSTCVFPPNTFCTVSAYISTLGETIGTHNVFFGATNPATGEYHSATFRLTVSGGSACDNDGTCDPGENHASCPGDCPVCSCSWVKNNPGSSCPAGDCSINIGGTWYNGLSSQCKCNNLGCGTCIDSTGATRQGDTWNDYCIKC